MKEVELTGSEGTGVFEFIYSLKPPMRLGDAKTPDAADKKFDVGQVSTITDQIRHLKKAFREVSPIYRKYRKPKFGPEHLYKEIKRSPEEQAKVDADPELKATLEVLGPDYDYDWTKRDEKVKVQLSGDAAKGLGWVCYYWLYPSSPFRQSIGQQDDIVWPIVEQIKAGPWMRDMLGLTKKAQEDVKFEDDTKVEEAKKSDKPAAA